MTTLLYTHESCVGHDPGQTHPENPGRLKAVLAALGDKAFDALERREAPRAETSQIARVHPMAFVDEVLAAVPDSGHAALDMDTILSPASGEAAPTLTWAYGGATS